MNDERLQQLYQEMLSRRLPSNRAGCVTPESLMDLVEKRGSEDERLRSLDHVMGCTRCREEFEMLRATVLAGHRIRSAIPLKTLAVAASIVFLAATGGGLLYRAVTGGGDREADVYRSGPGVVLVSPAGEIARGPVSFSWRSVPATLRYQVDVIDSAGRAVFSTNTADTSFALPDSVRLVPGNGYTWSVRAELSDGGAARGSPLQFRIQR